MHCWRRPIFLLILSSIVWISGCRSSQANPAPARQAAAKSQTPSGPAPKRPPHDSALSTYRNPGYGISFRYPRNYLLEEDFDSEDPSAFNAQQELEPGSILVATRTPIPIPRFVAAGSNSSSILRSHPRSANPSPLLPMRHTRPAQHPFKASPSIGVNEAGLPPALERRTATTLVFPTAPATSFSSKLSPAPTPIPVLASRKPTSPKSCVSSTKLFLHSKSTTRERLPAPCSGRACAVLRPEGGGGCYC